MPLKYIEEHLYCHCNQCNSENIHVVRSYLPNFVFYPLGIALLAITGVQPLPIKMMCNDCQNKFFASGIHH
jgi:hypothetical protein